MTEQITRTLGDNLNGSHVTCSASLVLSSYIINEMLVKNKIQIRTDNRMYSADFNDEADTNINFIQYPKDKNLPF